MSEHSANIDSLPLFLAHALVVEEEAVENYEELAHVLKAHHNDEVAALFEQMAAFGRKHADEVRQRAQGTSLPKLAPWEYQWPDGLSPEAGGAADAHYLMNTAHALRLAMNNEQRARDFYASVAEYSTDAAVRKLAAEFAAEEAEHLQLLQDWLARCPDDPEDWRDDPDEAHMPE